MNESKLRELLAKIMIWGVVAAALVMFAGGASYLINHPGAKPADHVFHGEPSDLRSPVEIALGAIHGHDTAIIQIGVLLLLFNPLVRVFFSVLGYIASRDRLYAGLSLIVFAVLVVSFFV